MSHNPNGRMMNDLLFLINLGFLAIIILLIPFINPSKDEDRTDPPPQGNLIVQMFWPDGWDCDVDLWVQVPLENGWDIPVGYSNKSTVTSNLLRDDLGASGDMNQSNMEVVYTRGLYDGEYRVNAHLFSVKTCSTPIPVRFEVGYKKQDTDSYRPLFMSSVELTYQGQEVTVMRWTMDEGELVVGSEHTAPIALRARRAGGVQ